jgi:CRISPR/Cas system-associated exonuclease Cas4 (RecB family)
MKLTNLKELEENREFVREAVTLASVATRIESFLEDMNVDPVKLHAEFDLGSAGRRTSIFHASSIGSQSGKSLDGKYPMGCGRELYYSLIGASSEGNWPPRNRRILDTGTAVHAQLQAYLTEIAKRSDGTETFVPEADINPNTNEIADQMDISGHTDGIYTVTTEKDVVRFGLEIKTINDAGYKKTSGPHAEHLMQGTVYQKCLDLPIMVFLYYNKNDSSIAEFAHVYDARRWEAIENKLNFVRECAMDEEPPERELGWNCKTCKFAGVCKPPKQSRAARVGAHFRKGK